MRALGIFGGTFDPIHYGHLRTAAEIRQWFALDEVRLMPCGDPPHKGGTVASAEERLQMVQVSVEHQPDLVADDRETRKDGPSWSVDSLASFRAEFPDDSLAMIIGMDAFLSLPTWHRWEELLGFAHIIVAHRPGWQLPGDGELGELLSSRGRANPAEIRSSTHGNLFVHAVTQLEIAASDIRSMTAGGQDCRFLVPEPVRKLISHLGCYKEGEKGDVSRMRECENV